MVHVGGLWTLTSLPHMRKKNPKKKIAKKGNIFLGLSYFPKKVLLSNVHYSINILHCLIVPLLPNTAVM